jgi:hypothetical protein
MNGLGLVSRWAVGAPLNPRSDRDHDVDHSPLGSCTRFDLADGKQILIHYAGMRSPGSSRCRTVRPFRSWADKAVA